MNEDDRETPPLEQQLAALATRPLTPGTHRRVLRPLFVVPTAIALVVDGSFMAIFVAGHSTGHRETTPDAIPLVAISLLKELIDR